MSANNNYRNFTRKSVEIQTSIAQKLKQQFQKPVYIYDISDHFKDAEVKIFLTYRYVEASDGRIAVLSQTAQETLPQGTFTAVMDFLQLPYTIDSIGYSLPFNHV